MSKADERYLKNQKLMEEYIMDKPDLKEMINIFKFASNGFMSSSIDTKLKISNGKQSKNCFYSYLTSETENPRILFTSVKNIPQIIISTKFTSIVAFTVDLISDMRIEKHEDKSIDWYSYNISFKYNKKFDYKLTVFVENKNI